MSSPIRIPDALLVKLNEIAGLLQVVRKHPVGVGEALEWVFKQLPEDYFEKLKKQAGLHGG